MLNVHTYRIAYRMSYYTIRLLGEGGVGKTAWIRNMMESGFERRYIATVGHEVHPYHITTNHGTFLLTLIDYYGQDKYASPQPYPLTNGVDATVLMFDLSRKISHTNLSRWHEMCNNEPVFLVGNKTDMESVVTPTYHIEHNLPYTAVSAKTGTVHDLLTPILRRLTGHNDLIIQ